MHYNTTLPVVPEGRPSLYYSHYMCVIILDSVIRNSPAEIEIAKKLIQERFSKIKVDTEEPILLVRPASILLDFLVKLGITFPVLQKSNMKYYFSEISLMIANIFDFAIDNFAILMNDPETKFSEAIVMHFKLPVDNTRFLEFYMKSNQWDRLTQMIIKDCKQKEELSLKQEVLPSKSKNHDNQKNKKS